ncbi:MAG: hypothetical protein ABSE56_05320 [Bryobacteraceae bacterium]
MSDYLSGVVARAWHLEPAVRPVIPSMFESPAAGGLVEAEVVTEAPSLRAASRQPMSAERDEHRSVENAAPEVSPASIQEVRVEHETVRELRVEGARSDSPGPEIRREIVEHATHSVTERLTRELRETELRELVIEAPAPPGAPVPRESRETAGMATPAAPRTPAPAPGHVPATRPASLPRREEPVEQEAAVQVTIGRVEVRAVFPPAPPAAPPKPRPAPVMPLEEYLKQGNRRGR